MTQEERDNKAAMTVEDLVWDMSLDGCCETLGSMDDYLGFYALVIFSDTDLADYPRLAPHKAAIVHVDSQGFKDYDMHETVESAQAIWYDIEREYTSYWDKAENSHD